MDQTAVFVDAGYLFKAAANALAGEDLPRDRLLLQAEKAIHLLSQIALEISGQRLLRVYWYDGAKPGSVISQHLQISNCDYAKIRLGYINSQGQQKGVDSLIITDLIELSRNRSISDAVLLGGDEDLRTGVFLSQQWGVRVHLLLVETKTNNSSPQLRQECDTVRTLTKNDILSFLSVIDDHSFTSPLAKTILDAVLAQLTSGRIEGAREYIKAENMLPRDVDKILSATASEKMNRKKIDQSELISLRAALRQRILKTR